MADITERESERITRETYDAAAEDWARDQSDPEFWRKEFEAFHSILPKGKILDIGCAYGRDYPMFRDAGYDYVGLDFSSAFLANMQEDFPEANLINGNMRAIPGIFREDLFDGFWAVASLLHIEKSDVRDVLKGIRQVVRPDGIGFISLKQGEGEEIVSETRDGWAVLDKRFFAYYQLDEFSQILRESGFEPILTGESSRVVGNTTWIEFFVRCSKAEENA